MARFRGLVIVATLTLCGGACVTSSPTPVTIPARPPAGNWVAVMALAPGTAIRVDDETGAMSVGTVVSVQDDGLTLSTDGHEARVLRPDVRRVVVVRRLTGAGARRGFLIGLVGGALQGVALTKNRVVFAPLFGVAWGAIGALFGAVQGSGESELTLVYVAPGGEVR